MDDVEPNLHHREDFYLAQIAYRIALGQVKDPTSLRIRQFLLRFASDAEEQDSLLERQDLTDTQKRKLAAEKSKASWFSWLGFFPK